MPLDSGFSANQGQGQLWSPAVKCVRNHECQIVQVKRELLQLLDKVSSELAQLKSHTLEKTLFTLAFCNNSTENIQGTLVLGIS